MHVVLSLNKALNIPRLSFLLQRPDPSAALTPDEIAALDLAKLSSPTESPTIITIRVDAKQAKGWAVTAKRGRGWVEGSLKARRVIKRGSERSADGRAVGIGYRRNQRGEVGCVPSQYNLVLVPAY